MMRLTEVSVKGYRALADFWVRLGALTVIIGPNATGKSTLLDVLAFVSEAISEGNITSPIARRGGMESLAWRGGKPRFRVELSLLAEQLWAGAYHLEVRQRPPGGPTVEAEQLYAEARPFIEVDDEQAVLISGDPYELDDHFATDVREHLEPTDLAVSRVRDPKRFPVQRWAHDTLSAWEFYLGFDVRTDAPMRGPYKLGSSTTGDQYLAPSAANLAGMLCRLRSTASFADNFAELEDMCRAAFPDFKSVGTRRGVTGSEEILEWMQADEAVFHAGELSDGILRFLCLAVLCVAPDPPPLVGIDQPEVGLHPGLLPIVADMLKGLAERTQLIVLTHSPELVNGFELDDIAVMTKDECGCHLHRPADRRQLRYLLGPTVGETMGGLHVSGELEMRPERMEAPAPLEGGRE